MRCIGVFGALGGAGRTAVEAATTKFTQLKQHLRWVSAAAAVANPA